MGDDGSYGHGVLRCFLSSRMFQARASRIRLLSEGFVEHISRTYFWTRLLRYSTPSFGHLPDPGNRFPESPSGRGPFVGSYRGPAGSGSIPSTRVVCGDILQDALVELERGHAWAARSGRRRIGRGARKRHEEGVRTGRGGGSRVGAWSREQRRAHDIG